MEEFLTIGEVARQAGIRPSALRYYESAGLLPVARRVSGQRRYDAKVLSRLAIIQFAQRTGFTVAEIRNLFDSSERSASARTEWQPFARQKLVEVENLIAQASEMKHLLEESLECECLNLDDCEMIALNGRRQECQTPLK